MFNSTAGLWNAHLEPPPLGAHSKRWCRAWDDYLLLYHRFELARIDPDQTDLEDAIADLSNCDYVHLQGGCSGRTRVIQSNGYQALDITDRRSLLVPPRNADQVIWCSDASVNLDTRTGLMRDMVDQDDERVLQCAEPDKSVAHDSHCLYLTKDPRTSRAYADALWLVAKQVAKPGVGRRK